MAENVVVLEPGDERAQKIARAMASQTAGDILRILGEGPKSLTGITERLEVPLTTAKYHVENLLEAGLLSVSETKYSVKGREVKLYSLTNQLVIVAPRQSNVRAILLKYASLFCMVIFGTLGLAFLLPLLAMGGNGPGNMAEAAVLAAPAPAPGRDQAWDGAAKAAYETVVPQAAPFPETALAFFIGGSLVILVLLVYEFMLIKKEKSR
jgi:DNA-binding transcriptional ArsR family regulator